jgi:DNA invertase Pin-like site-specific DNA recombinase
MSRPFLCLGRLAPSSRDLHNILHELEQLCCGFVSLREAWCDTTTDVGRLMMAIMGASPSSSVA